MAQLDKTFPTLDCSSCILTPKMVEVARHKNIHLLTYSEVEDVSGYIGNYRVKIRNKPRYVDERKCTGCGECASACRRRGRIASEFEMGLAKRSAIYIPFPQAVPPVYTVDAEKCLYITKGKCGESPACVDACPADAIDFTQKEREMEIEVGTIIVATGYELLDASELPEYGYKYEEVLTGLEFERLSVASGPTGGRIVINGKEPKQVVFISCVGSREREREKEPRIGTPYCSRICCMYIAKQAHLIREKIPDAHVWVIYNDVRAYGKGFEEFYNRIREEGVEYIRKELEEPVRVEKEKEEESGVVVRTRSSDGRTIEIKADLVVLATAIVPAKGTEELARILKLTRSEDGFFMEAHPKLRPLDTFTDGIFVAGCCQSPKDIPDSVAQAIGAAMRASIPLMQGEVEIEPLVAEVDVGLCTGGGICEAICPSGAISLKHFRDKQIYAQIEAILRLVTS